MSGTSQRTRDDARTFLASAFNGKSPGDLTADERARINTLARLAGFGRGLGEVEALAAIDDATVRARALDAVRAAYWPVEHLTGLGRGPEPPALAIHREIGEEVRFVVAGDHGEDALPERQLGDIGRVHKAMSAATGVVARRITVRDGYDLVWQALIDAADDVDLGTAAGAAMWDWVRAYVAKYSPVDLEREPERAGFLLPDHWRGSDGYLRREVPHAWRDPANPDDVLVSTSGLRRYLLLDLDEWRSANQLAAMARAAHWPKTERADIYVTDHDFGERVRHQPRCWRFAFSALVSREEVNE